MTLVSTGKILLMLSKVSRSACRLAWPRNQAGRNTSISMAKVTNATVQDVEHEDAVRSASVSHPRKQADVGPEHMNATAIGQHHRLEQRAAQTGKCPMEYSNILEPFEESGQGLLASGRSLQKRSRDGTFTSPYSHIP